MSSLHYQLKHTSIKTYHKVSGTIQGDCITETTSEGINYDWNGEDYLYEIIKNTIESGQFKYTIQVNIPSVLIEVTPYLQERLWSIHGANFEYTAKEIIDPLRRSIEFIPITPLEDRLMDGALKDLVKNDISRYSL